MWCICQVNNTRQVSYAVEFHRRQLNSKTGQLAEIACNMIFDLSHDELSSSQKRRSKHNWMRTNVWTI